LSKEAAPRPSTSRTGAHHNPENIGTLSVDPAHGNHANAGRTVAEPGLKGDLAKQAGADGTARSSSTRPFVGQGRRDYAGNPKRLSLPNRRNCDVQRRQRCRFAPNARYRPTDVVDSCDETGERSKKKIRGLSGKRTISNTNHPRGGTIGILLVTAKGLRLATMGKIIRLYGMAPGSNFLRAADGPTTRPR